MSKRAWILLVVVAFGLLAGAGGLRLFLPRQHLARANESIGRQQWDVAAAQLDKFLAWRPLDVPALMLRAEVAVGQKKIDEAIEFLDRVPAESPQSAAATRRKGELLLAEHRGPEAERALVAALERNHHLVEAMLPLSTYYAVIGRDREAIDLCWQVYKETSHPARRFSILKKIVSIESGLEPSDLLNDLEQFSAKSPGDEHTQIALGTALIQSGRLSDGVSLLESALRAGAGHVRTRAALADAYLQLARVEEAEAVFGVIGANSAADGPAWRTAGRLAESRQDWRQAAEAFAAAANDPRIAAECHYQLATALERLNEEAAAREHRDQAVQLERARRELLVAKLEFDREERQVVPARIVPIVVRLGTLYEELGWKSAAAAWFREATVLAPGHPEATVRFDRLRNQLAQVGISDMTEFAARLRESISPPGAPSRPESDDSFRGPSRVRWRDVAGPAGVRFQYANGARGNFALRETMGPGVATFDFDADGHIDIFMINSGTGPGSGPSELSQLLRGRDNLHFAEVTGPAGLTSTGYFQGCAAADFDNDGFDDLFVSGYREHRLFHNNGDGTFGDATESLGPAPKLWETSCAFGELTGDGCLSLYVATYLLDDPDQPSPCRGPDGQPAYCLPHNLDGLPDLLFVNRGDGQFKESGESLGVADRTAKGLGVVIANLDDDGWPDIFVANDTTPNQLFVNSAGTRFVEDGLSRGAAYGGNGRVRAGMGIACGDTANRATLDLLVTNFYQEPNTFLWNLGGQFQDRGPTSGLAGPSYLKLGFATLFLDGDNDGWLDCFVANGHINAKNPGHVEQAMSAQWFANLGGGRFKDSSHGAGPYFDARFVGRGAAAADLNNDGRVDLVVTHQDQPPALLANETPDAGHAIVFELVGTASNRSSIGARVTCRAGDLRLMREIIGGGSYLSASDSRLFLGLGEETEATDVEIRWPSGTMQRAERLHVGRWRIHEGQPPSRVTNE